MGTGTIVLIGAVVIVAIVLIAKYLKSSGGGGAEKSGYHKISAKEARKMLDENKKAILLDVRTKQEFKSKRIKGAILIPHNEIAKKASSKLPDKDAVILTYCMSGTRSKAAAKQLVSMGYINVYDFGSIMAYPYETISG